MTPVWKQKLIVLNVNINYLGTGDGDDYSTPWHFSHHTLLTVAVITCYNTNKLKVKTFETLQRAHSRGDTCLAHINVIHYNSGKCMFECVSLWTRVSLMFAPHSHSEKFSYSPRFFGKLNFEWTAIPAAPPHVFSLTLDQSDYTTPALHSHTHTLWLKWSSMKMPQFTCFPLSWGAVAAELHAAFMEIRGILHVAL